MDIFPPLIRVHLFLLAANLDFLRVFVTSWFNLLRE